MVFWGNSGFFQRQFWIDTNARMGGGVNSFLDLKKEGWAGPLRLACPLASRLGKKLSKGWFSVSTE
jgi:hypothetical protein